MTTIDRVVDSIVTTKGINSKVFNDNGDVVGHVLLCDYDGATCTYVDMLKEVMELPGINVILKSSDSNYHAWNLSVRNLGNTLFLKAGLHDDSNHTEVGFRRQSWTLRTFPKYDRNDEVYKDSPVIEQVVVNNTSMLQSKPHTRYLHAMLQSQEEPLKVDETNSIESLGFLGESKYQIEEYMSVMDSIKEELEKVSDE